MNANQTGREATAPQASRAARIAKPSPGGIRSQPLALALSALATLALAAPPPISAQALAPRSVKVARGDTLDGLSQRYGVSVAELKRLNGLKDADLLQVGQTLLLPAPPRKGVVLVKSGDTLESIAKAHQTSVAALQKANPGLQPDKLKVGSTLRLPGAPASPSGAAKAVVAKAKPASSAASSAVPPAPAAAASPVKRADASAPPIPAAPPTSPTSLPSSEVIVPGNPSPATDLAEPASRGRWRYYGDTVVDWGSWKRLPDGVRFTLVQPGVRDVGEGRALATAIAVDCSTLRHTWRVKEAWEAWSVPAPRSVGQRIVLDLCGNTSVDDRRPVPPPPSPTP